MKNRKHGILLITLILTAALTLFASNTQNKPDKEAYKIAILADAHYFSKKLNVDDVLFNKYLSKDRKLLHLSAEITEEAVKEISNEDYDLVILPGDLTKDGEKKGHEEFVQQLQKIQNSGKRIFVICGNHDINNPSAIKFEENKVTSVESVSADEFRDIYFDMGYSQAVERDVDSLSYVCEPSTWLRIIAMDSCFYDLNYENNYPFTGGFFSDETFNWVIKMINEGKEKGQIVLGFMHHGLIPHLGIQEQFFPEYLIKNWENIAGLFADSGMNLVFTGHFHAQDISKYTSENGNKIWDVQTGSLVTYPVPYRTVMINKDGVVNIKTHNILKTSSTDDLYTYSKDFLYQGLKTLIPEKIEEKIVDFGIPKEFANAYVTSLLNGKSNGFTLIEIAARVVTEFYGGDENASPELTKAIKQLKENQDNKFLALFGSLADSFITDTIPQDNNITINLK
jgi:predicted MPP superfamily phosphohydrolase